MPSQTHTFLLEYFDLIRTHTRERNITIVQPKYWTNGNCTAKVFFFPFFLFGYFLVCYFVFGQFPLKHREHFRMHVLPKCIHIYYRLKVTKNISFNMDHEYRQVEVSIHYIIHHFNTKQSKWWQHLHRFNSVFFLFASSISLTQHCPSIWHVK